MNTLLQKSSPAAEPAGYGNMRSEGSRTLFCKDSPECVLLLLDLQLTVYADFSSIVNLAVESGPP